jgi:CheY-like chemotaxis protein
MSLSFILVENAELDQYVAAQLIRKIAGEADIKSFFTGEEALDHIAGDIDGHPLQRVILLDLMMPEMSGGEFITRFEKLPQGVKNKYQIIIITSSMDKPELERLNKRKSVSLMLQKPLTQEKLAAALAHVSAVENKPDAWSGK